MKFVMMINYDGDCDDDKIMNDHDGHDDDDEAYILTLGRCV